MILSAAFRMTWQRRKIVGILYLIFLAAGLIPAIPFYSDFLEAAHNSTEPDRLIGQFDFMTFADLFRRLKGFLPHLFLYSSITAVISLFIYIFLSGWVIAALHDPRIGLRALFRESSLRLFRFLTLFLIQVLYLLLACSIGLLLFFTGIRAAEGGLEPRYFYYTFPAILWSALTLTVITASGDHAKILLYRYTSLSPFSAFHRSLRYLLKKPGTVTGFLFLFLLPFALFLLLGTLPGLLYGENLWLVILSQQLFTFFKWFVRISRLAFASVTLHLQPIPLLTVEVPDQT